MKWTVGPQETAVVQLGIENIYVFSVEEIYGLCQSSLGLGLLGKSDHSQ